MGAIWSWLTTNGIGQNVTASAILAPIAAVSVRQHLKKVLAAHHRAILIHLDRSGYATHAEPR